MAAPDHEVKESYTHDEVQHLIAWDRTQNDISGLKMGAAEVQRQLVETVGTSNIELKSLRETLVGFPNLIATQISQCRRDLRDEIEKDFPSKMEAVRMEQRIEEKIGETDSTLGKQISALDKKIDSRVDSLESKVDKMWIKITMTVAALGAGGSFIWWLLSTISASRMVLGG